MITAARGWLAEIAALDQAVYDAVAAASTPRLDDAMRRLSVAANYSRISVAEALLLGVAFGPRGRRAAATGLVSVALTSAVVNALIKPVGRRPRPQRDDAARDDPARPPRREVKMPRSRSFPSGHTASAVAFASGAGRELPLASVPLHALAAVVAYSRVQTGVHYPADVIAGAVIGSACADGVASALARRGS
jgi:membrane-associated phospholipid phosphatase